MQLEPNDFANDRTRAYLLYRRNFWGRRGKLIGVYQNASQALKDIGYNWTNEKEILYAADRYGKLCEITAVGHLLRPVAPPLSAGAF